MTELKDFGPILNDGGTENGAEVKNATVPRHPYEKLDRASRAALARSTAGVSPYSIMATWMDWAVHLGRSPGRQLELAERAVANTAKIGQYATQLALSTKTEPPFSPRSQDHRFTDTDWQKAPYAQWQQAFLATQDWWQAATEPMPGIAARDAERAQFQVRQALDLFSPSKNGLLEEIGRAHV